MEINNTPVSFNIRPKLCAGRVLAPVRDLAGALGATVEWAPEGRKIIVKKAGTQVQMTLDSNLATVNGVPAELPGVIRPEAGSAMVPVRFLAESLGYKVNWQPGKVHISQE